MGKLMEVDSRRGFTLLELLIVITIIGIVATLATVSVDSTDTRQVESAAHSLANDLRLARQLAVQHGSEYAVRFDESRQQYSVHHVGTSDLPQPTSPDKPGEKYVVSLSDLPSLSGHSGLSIESIRLSPSRTTVTEITFGRTGGTGPGRSEDTVITIARVFGNKTTRVAVRVAWQTGMVSVGSAVTSPNGSGGMD